MEILNRADRACQFAPFDALKGFREALKEKERMIIPKAELSEERTEELERKLHAVQSGSLLTVIYYHNGQYEKITGMVSDISKTSRSLTIVHTTICFDDIRDMEGDFKDYEGF
ncbi:MAG: YolD-like family protein [Thermoflexaceae bacterium]|nr:YolD-like family protein [Thermoflexaceae bacterium]